MKTYFNKTLLGATAAVLTVGFAMSSAQALPSVGSRLFGGAQLLSDNSAEFLVKGAGNVAAGIVEVGDSLRGIFSVDTTEKGGSPVNIGGAASNELTGLFQLEITAKAALAGAIGGGVCAAVVCFSFGPSAAFVAEVAGMGFSNTAGAMVAFFEDIDGNDFNRQISTGAVAADIAAMEATAKDGNKFWLAGISSAFDFWSARTDTDDISKSGDGSLAPIFQFGRFDLGLSLLDNPTGPGMAPVACTTTFTLALGSADFCGNGGLFAKGAPAAAGAILTSYDSLDDVNFNVNVVPEPGTIGLLGLGLFGLGALRRRNRKAAA